jgi:hypothetical protein
MHRADGLPSLIRINKTLGVNVGNVGKNDGKTSLARRFTELKQFLDAVRWFRAVRNPRFAILPAIEVSPVNGGPVVNLR